MRRFIRQSDPPPRHACLRQEDVGGDAGAGNKSGFTIVELLTVMSIIIILIGILVPSLSMVNRYAKDVKQRAQFHGIEAALELFKGEFEGYPDSTFQNEVEQKPYPGAARLCEAMMGQDLLGFHPASLFRSDGGSPTNLAKSLYKESDWTPAEWTDNLRARKGPYLQLEKANAYRLEYIYDGGLLSGGSMGDINPELFVLCDEYARVKNRSTGKRIGMPVLYYKANTAGIRHDPNDYLDDKENIYNYIDNHYLVGLGMPFNPPKSWGGDPKHPMYLNNEKKFYENTKNEKITLTAGRPYRSDSYILLSAGFDGQYGTPDDIFNFEKE